MRSPKKVWESAGGGITCISQTAIAPCPLCPQSLAPKLSEGGLDLPEVQLTRVDKTHLPWVYLPKGLVRRPAGESPQANATPRDEPGAFAHQRAHGLAAGPTSEDGPRNAGASLFQDSFFFCKVAGIGDVSGLGRIYVETAVERDSGLAFAKVYASKTAMSAVDLLSSRVVPFFERHGIAIREIQTRKKPEYCGLAPAHPYETFLATSNIPHLHFDTANEAQNELCDRFYTVLLNEFLLPALRKKFRLSLDDLQRDLDAFVDAHNDARLMHFSRSEHHTNP